MLYATKIGFCSGGYMIAADGVPVARWDGATAANRSRLYLGAWPYHVWGSTWGRQFDMATQHGVVVAAARDVGRIDWTVGADNQVYDFHRRSHWLGEAELRIAGQPAGIIRRVSCFSGNAVADLPPMSLLAQVFALSVALCAWDAEAESAAVTVSAAVMLTAICAVG